MEYLDMLSALGIGSAHPGGFAATLSQLEQFPIPAGARVLEVGCGTGRTTCYLAKMGCRMVGLDIRQDMLKKAALRANAEGLDVQFVHGDAAALPFENETFDVVFAESVTNFVNAEKALSEYYRVLAPGGVLYDREVMITRPLDEESLTAVYRFFGMESAYSEAEWLRLLGSTGFKSSEVSGLIRFAENMTDEIPDHFQFPDAGTITDFRIWQTVLKHDDLIVEHRENLGSGILIARK
ncbi:class I SAM-dependent methyltransferase [Paenibacillus thalictri]|uniref:Class I SAM-dependent methyltransferase n=1 Tax=Paenibacillus thalictri TaxID=2527873 RepID=A0A4Q9DYS1_9BACL|nr:class I SAM-dependent methyltransferase [Paenibacillus thalictri]TBL81556.1 class I SAM-dependent methyltransferase [Paenibacillus thalictri]